MAEPTEPTETTEPSEGAPTPEPAPEPTPEPAADATPEPQTDPNEALAERIEGMSKAFQRVTQEIAQLTKKVNGGGELTAVDRAKLHAAEAEAQAVRQQLESYDATGDTGNPDQGIDKAVTKGVLTLTKRMDALEAENKALKAKVAQAAPMAEYDKALWKEAVTSTLQTHALKIAQAQLEAGKISQEVFDETLQGAASALYHEKAEASKKAKKLPVAGSPPPKPPNGGRVVPMTRGGAPSAPAKTGDPFYDLVMEESRKMDE